MYTCSLLHFDEFIINKQFSQAQFANFPIISYQDRFWVANNEKF